MRPHEKPTRSLSHSYIIERSPVKHHVGISEVKKFQRWKELGLVGLAIGFTIAKPGPGGGLSTIRHPFLRAIMRKVNRTL